MGALFDELNALLNLPAQKHSLTVIHGNAAPDDERSVTAAATHVCLSASVRVLTALGDPERSARRAPAQALFG